MMMTMMLLLLLLLVTGVPSGEGYFCRGGLVKRGRVLIATRYPQCRLSTLHMSDKSATNIDAAVREEKKSGFSYYFKTYGVRYVATWVATYLSILTTVYIAVSTQGKTFGFDPENLVVKTCSFLQDKFGERDWISFMTDHKKFYGDFFVAYLTTDLIPTTLIAASFVWLSVRMQEGRSIGGSNTDSNVGL